MSRIHKYKAWDRIDKRMCDVGYIDFANEKAQLAIIVDNLRMAYGTWERPLKDVELREFTGLHDKNGKEIYEGDRVKVLQSNGLPWYGVVEFIDGCFDVVVQTRRGSVRNYVKTYVANHVIEIIGNIHENPDRLEESE